MATNKVSAKLKELRKANGVTQVDLAMKSGVGLNFVRELEQGKATVRMDKVSQVFAYFLTSSLFCAIIWRRMEINELCKIIG